MLDVAVDDGAVGCLFLSLLVVDCSFLFETFGVNSCCCWWCLILAVIVLVGGDV